MSLGHISSEFGSAGLMILLKGLEVFSMTLEMILWL